MIDPITIQSALATAGHYSGALDGIFGPRSRAAAYAFSKPVGVELPWITEAEKVIGLHEVADSDELRAFLRSDGPTLGDPARRGLPRGGDVTDLEQALADVEAGRVQRVCAPGLWVVWRGDDGRACLEMKG